MNLNIRYKTIKTSARKKKQEKIYDLGPSKQFLNLTSNVQSVEGRIDKFDSIKFEHFFSAKDPIKG